MLKVLELFGGIGAPRKALQNIGINVKSIDYVEILPYAVQAYNRIFCNDYCPQDITKWNRNVDLLVHGSPCQDWSTNGKNDVSTGRSILYERTLEIIEHELTPRPSVVVWENVTGLLSKRHRQHFDAYLAKMESLGYTNTYDTLVADDYGTPQGRPRVFVVSVLNGPAFTFPQAQPLANRLLDYIDRSVCPTDYALSANELSLFFEWAGQLYVKTNNSERFTEVNDGDSINVEFPNSTTRRGRVQRGRVPTLTTNPHVAVYYDGILRKISPREVWRLTGYTDADFDNVAATGIPQTALYKLPGNSIVVTVLEAIFDALVTQGHISA